MGTFAGDAAGGGVGLRVSRIIRRGVRTIAGRSRVRRPGWGAVRCVMRLHIPTQSRLSGRHRHGMGTMGEAGVKLEKSSMTCIRNDSRLQEH